MPKTMQVTAEMIRNVAIEQLLQIDAKSLEAEAATALRDRLLIEWEASKKTLETAKEKELILRAAAVATMHDPSKSGSTENVELGNGYKAKMKVPVNYGFVKTADNKVDKKRIEKALQRIEKFGEAGELVAERLIDWKPSLSLTEYKQLPDNWRKIIDDVVVTSEGTPTLEIVEPKNK
ncbi:hypothetical protein [Pseudomonas phage KP1]|uniref:Uncharacterized protein n=1 Tax=Pseudomonas phage KP1 TaxID=2562463 RepID=A0A6G5QAK7_9CAUD|nr:hypothetical protein PM391_gp31 [Pseudomonas phage KP1]QBZ71741.1 hypothetical protein [Pseudomonas phage KP1]